MVTATETPATPTTPEISDDDAFAAAFSQFGTGDTPPSDPAPAAADTPVDEQAPTDVGAADANDVAAEGDTPPIEEPETPAPAATPSDEDLLARLAALVKAPPAPVAADTLPPAAEPDVYTADEQALLQEYEKDWPDVAKAEALKRRAEYRDLVNHVFSEVAKELGPLAQTLRTLAERTHLTDLHEKVEDYDTVRDKVVDWVNTQPAYLQSAYKHVIQQGTPDEIADLVARYKKEVQADTPTPAPKKAATELPTTTKQAVEALAPVSSKRSVIVEANDPNDFEGAFAEFAKQA